MANFLKLNNGTILKVREGGSISNYVYDALTYEDGLRVAALFTPENISHLETYGTFNDPAEIENREEPNGDYYGLLCNNVYFDTLNMQVLISLREKTEDEERLDAIEEEQEIQNEAIDYLAME